MDSLVHGDGDGPQINAELQVEYHHPPENYYQMKNRALAKKLEETMIECGFLKKEVVSLLEENFNLRNENRLLEWKVKVSGSLLGQSILFNST